MPELDVRTFPCIFEPLKLAISFHTNLIKLFFLFFSFQMLTFIATIILQLGGGKLIYHRVLKPGRNDFVSAHPEGDAKYFKVSTRLISLF